MEHIVNKVLAGLPIEFGGLSEYADQFELFVTQHLGAIPLPLVYLFLLVAFALLVYSLVRFVIRLALFVVVPTLGSALVVSYAVPSLEMAKVVPVAGIIFVIIFIFKH